MSGLTHGCILSERHNPVVGTNLQSVAAVEREYLDATANFPFFLPPGFTFAPRAPLEDHEPNAIYEPRYGVSLALSQWTTAVEQAILTAGESARTEYARDMARQYLEATRTRFFSEIVLDRDDITGDFLRAVIERGDFSELRDWLSASA